MASALTKLFSSVFGPRRNRKIAILGLDGAGGIELLQRLCGEPIEKIKDERTWGIIYTATDNKLKCDFVVVEVGGSAKPAHHQWLAAQFCDADGFIWIVDATDTDRLEESKEEMAICRKGRKLSKGLEQPGVRPDAPWLILFDFKKTPLVVIPRFLNFWGGSCSDDILGFN